MQAKDIPEPAFLAAVASARQPWGVTHWWDIAPVLAEALGGECDCRDCEPDRERTAALLAVLELHRPENTYGVHPDLLASGYVAKPWCVHCDFDGQPLNWPCETVKVIAGALGVELVVVA